MMDRLATLHDGSGVPPASRPKRMAAGAILVAVTLLVAAPTAAAWLEVPDGFVTELAPAAPPEPDRKPPIDPRAGPPVSQDWIPILTVRPEPGPFADLSAVHLRQVVGTVTDPDEWLRRRVAADFGGETVAEGLLDSPDSPFADPTFDVLRDALPRLFGGLEQLGRLPLQFCEGPVTAYNAAGSLRELACSFQVGPFRQFMTFRLQEVDGSWYYTQVRSMNERRLRHLLAIANSFRPATPGEL